MGLSSEAVSKKDTKNNDKKSKAVFIALSLLLLAGICALLLISTQKSFNGSRIKNPEAFLLDIDRMNGTDLHMLELKTY